MVRAEPKGVQEAFTEEVVWLSSEGWGGLLAIEVEDQSGQRKKATTWGFRILRPHGTFFQEWLPEEFVERISQLDTQSPVTKINGKGHSRAELALLTLLE